MFMEMTKHDFVKALIKYFSRELAEKTKSREQLTKATGELSGDVYGALVKLADQMEHSPVKDEKVHIGHTFGPFGFEIKED